MMVPGFEPATTGPQNPASEGYLTNVLIMVITVLIWVKGLEVDGGLEPSTSFMTKGFVAIMPREWI